jgi:hypothetical protein
VCLLLEMKKGAEKTDFIYCMLAGYAGQTGPVRQGMASCHVSHLSPYNEGYPPSRMPKGSTVPLCF